MTVNNIKYHGNPVGSTRLHAGGQRDGQANIRLIGVLREYATAPENPTIDILYLSELEF
jgi:hypothetical protein